MRRAARKDANHASIVAELESYGIVVFDCSQVGNGLPDILCYGFDRESKSYQWLPMEIKSGNDVRKKKADGSNELTPRQKRLQEKRCNAPFHIVHTDAEAIALYGIVKS